MTSPLRVLLVDPEPLQRDGWRLLLEASGSTVVAETGDATEALALLRLERVDVAIVDARLPGLPGTELVAAALGDARVRLAQRDGGVRFVVVAAMDVDRVLSAGLDAGASAVLAKDAPAEALLAAVAGR